MVVLCVNELIIVIILYTMCILCELKKNIYIIYNQRYVNMLVLMRLIESTDPHNTIKYAELQNSIQLRRNGIISIN